MAWTTSKGFNFRFSDTYVTDGANQTYVEDAGDGTGEAYPVSRSIGGESVTFGWESTYSDQCRDRTTSATYDPELSGFHQTASGGSDIVFRVDLPAAGDYKIRIAAGEASYDRVIKFQVRDNTTDLITVSNVSAVAGSFVDAGGTSLTAANWYSSNEQVTETFASTIFRFVLQAPTSDFSVIAHIEIEQVGGGSIVPQAMASYRQQ
jgi:hypothetical protein